MIGFCAGVFGDGLTASGVAACEETGRDSTTCFEVDIVFSFLGICEEDGRGFTTGFVADLICSGVSVWLEAGLVSIAGFDTGIRT